MKRLLLILVMSIVVLSMAGTAVAEEWYTANQATVRWDAVTTLLNSDPVPEGDLVSYNVYTRSVQTGLVFEVATGVAEVEYTITLSEEGDYHIGVRAVRTVPAVGELPARVVDTSDIGWSSDPLIAKDGVTFGVSYYYSLSVPGGLGI